MKLKVLTHCKECGQDFDNLFNLAMHIRNTHSFSTKEYYDKFYREGDDGYCPVCGKETAFKTLSYGYGRFCSKKCTQAWKKFNDNKEPITCKVCGLEITGDSTPKIISKFIRHLKDEHNLTSKEYYDSYLKKPGEGICPICGKPTKYLKYTAGYNKFCSTDCQHKYLNGINSDLQKQYNKIVQEEKKIVQDEQMIQEQWKKECARRLAEFDYKGQRASMTYTDFGFEQEFQPDITFFDCF